MSDRAARAPALATVARRRRVALYSTLRMMQGEAEKGRRTNTLTQHIMTLQ